jgi:threonine/homoserine/homoserine lactone efflux protein
MTSLLVGLTIGLATGIAPGALLLLVVTSALQSGWRMGAAVACAPLVSDIPVVAGVLLVLDRLPQNTLAVLGIAGGLLIIHTGIQAVLDARTADLTPSGPPGSSATRALRRAATINLLSPHPWIFWATVFGPLTIATAGVSSWDAVALVLGFYLGLVGAKTGLAALVAGQRRRLSRTGYRRALVGAGGLLTLTGALLLIEYVPVVL